MKTLRNLLLPKPSLKLAAAESLTSGQVQAAIGAVSGASDYFLGGVTAYTLDEKVRLLRVDPRAAKQVKCVSAEIAEQMARGVCELFESDLGVATTGYAEPSKKDGVADPFAYWALAHRSRRGKWISVVSARVECPGASRVDTQHLVTETVLTRLEEYLARWRQLRRRQ